MHSMALNIFSIGALISSCKTNSSQDDAKKNKDIKLKSNT